MELLIYLGAVFTSLILSKYLPSYVSEKAKNLATKEDIEDITKKVENIKADNQIKIDKKIKEFSKKDKAYEELKILYIKIHEMIEETIKKVENSDVNNLSSQFSKITAEVQMTCPNNIIEKYLIVARLCQDWTSLYMQAYPNNNMIYSKNIDPTLKYKEPEKKAYDKFYKEYQNLIQEMRSDLISDI